MCKYTTICENCGEEYINYFRTFYVKENGIKRCVCEQCRNDLRNGKIWFTDHIPAFVDGADLLTIIFNSIEELTKHIVSETDSDFIATYSDGIITDVNKNENHWWVRGYVSHEISLPEFYETITKLGYK